jgi:hypothetical protein
MRLLFVAYLLSAFSNAIPAEQIFMSFYDITFFYFNFLTPSNCGQNLATVADTYRKHPHAFLFPRKHMMLNVRRNKTLKH